MLSLIGVTDGATQDLMQSRIWATVQKDQDKPWCLLGPRAPVIGPGKPRYNQPTVQQRHAAAAVYSDSILAAAVAATPRVRPLRGARRQQSGGAPAPAPQARASPPAA